MGASLTHVVLARAAQLFAAAFKHAEETGHVNLVCADHPPRLGIACVECEMTWESPIPGPGRFMDWPHHEFEGRRFNFTLAQGRRDFLAHGISELVKKRAPAPVVGPSAWDWIRKRDGVGW